MKNKFQIAMTLAVVLAMLVTSLALADSLIGDALTTAPGTSDNMSVTLAGGTTWTYEFGALISNTGGSADNVFPGTVNVDITRSGDWLSSSSGTPNTLSFSDYSQTRTGTITISVPCNSVGILKVMTVLLSADPSTNGKSLDSNKDTVELKYNITAGANGSNCDSTPPVWTVPANFSVEATGPSGAVVTYMTSVSDPDDAVSSQSCTPASGSTFALGTTTVNCTATDTHSNTGTASFTVTVEDTTDPVFTLPADQTFEGNVTGGYNGAYTGATATDVVDASPVVACTPSSPSFFALGDTTVNCTATDGSGNSSSGSFTVTVVDTTDPVLTVPSNMTVTAVNASGAAVSFSASATDIVDSLPTVVCTPASGSTFPIGTTTVNCTATDDSGNSSDGSFTVTVQYATTGMCNGSPAHSILQPINTDGSSVFKQKSTVPAKFRVCGTDGVSIGTPGVVTSFKLVKVVSGTGTETPNEDPLSTTPDTIFRWSSTDMQWIFNINTKNLSASKTYYYEITLNDGSKIEFHFGLK